MSRFRDTSELTALNRTAGSGVARPVSARLRRALVAADRAHRVTDGRFDPRVLADLDRLGYRGAPVDDGAAATSRPGEAAVGPQEGPVVEWVGRDRMAVGRAVDLGGIGKGLTLRWAAAMLEADGADDFMLEAGGDLVTRGRSPDGGPWHVGIEDPVRGDPERGDAPLAVIAVGDQAVATSSTRVHRWTVDGRLVHHLVDPQTGEPADAGLAAVTVASPDPAWAEVWSKVLFLGGRGGIAAEARARGLAAWWVADDGTLEMTAAARALTIWVAAEADQPVRNRFARRG
jgi:thiamine biosynthesis lipoprotein